MAKSRTQFLCNSCGSVHPKWMGKCPDCGTWDAWRNTKRRRPMPRRGAARQRANWRTIAHGGGGRGARRDRRGRRAAHADRHRRVRPHPRRRDRARLGGARRRGAGDREVDAAASSGARTAGVRGRQSKSLDTVSAHVLQQGPLRHQRRIRPTDEAPRVAAGRRLAEPARAGRDQRRADHQPDPQDQARRSW